MLELHFNRMGMTHERVTGVTCDSLLQSSRAKSQEYVLVVQWHVTCDTCDSGSRRRTPARHKHSVLNSPAYKTVLQPKVSCDARQTRWLGTRQTRGRSMPNVSRDWRGPCTCVHGPSDIQLLVSTSLYRGMNHSSFNATKHEPL